MIIEKIYGILEPRIKEMVEDAYRQGAADMDRRLLEVYHYGMAIGYDNAKAEIGEIDLGDINV